MPGLYAGASLARCLELLQAATWAATAPGEAAFSGLRAAHCSRPIASGSTGQGAAGSARALLHLPRQRGRPPRATSWR